MSETTITPEEVAAIRDRYRVEPQNWLELEPGYKGNGIARFTTNPGTVSGPTVVRFAEDGALTEFSMTVEAIEAEPEISRADAFIFVNSLPDPDSPGSFGLGPSANECATVEVSGTNFTLAPAQRTPVTALGGSETPSRFVPTAPSRVTKICHSRTTGRCR